MKHLANASKIGDTIIRQGLSYCEDDHSFYPYTYAVKAWACSLEDRTLRVKEPEGDLFIELFGDR